MASWEEEIESGRKAPVVTAYFDPLQIVKVPSLPSFWLVGQRRGVIIPHLQQVTVRRQAESLHQSFILLEQRLKKMPHPNQTWIKQVFLFRKWSALSKERGYEPLARPKGGDPHLFKWKVKRNIVKNMCNVLMKASWLIESLNIFYLICGKYGL